MHRVVVLPAAVALLLWVAAPVLAAVSGKEIYQKYCQTCHGVDGKGSAQAEKMFNTKIPDLTSAPTKKEPELIKLLQDGKPPMPPFGKSLKPDEIRAVLEYGKTLRRK